MDKKRNYSILIGNAIDHFDTALYGFLAPIFAKEFFPNTDPVVSLILAYSVFATTIVTRPLGSYIFGMIAQSHGAAMSLSYSLIGVAISTAALGFIPTYDHIGPWAPIFLIIFRAFSGIFSSGEITIAKLYILENDHSKNRNSYLYQTSTMIGIVMASCVSTIILADGYEHYWRLCFILGGVMALFGYHIRIYKSEKLLLNTQQLLKLYSTSAFFTFWRHKILLLRIALVTGFSYITYSIPFIVMNSLAPEFANVKIEQMMKVNTVLLVIDMLLLPTIGSRISKFDASRTLLLCVMLLFFSSFPIYFFAKDASFIYLILIKIWIIFIGVIFACKINLWSNELIKGGEKYLIVGIGGSIGSATIGKMTPAICTSLYYYFSSPLVFAWFIAFVAIGAIWALMYKN